MSLHTNCANCTYFLSLTVTFFFRKASGLENKEKCTFVKGGIQGIFINSRDVKRVQNTKLHALNFILSFTSKVYVINYIYLLFLLDAIN